jgi:hypothetical protein
MLFYFEGLQNPFRTFPLGLLTPLRFRGLDSTKEPLDLGGLPASILSPRGPISKADVIEFYCVRQGRAIARGGDSIRMQTCARLRKGIFGLSNMTTVFPPHVNTESSQ